VVEKLNDLAPIDDELLPSEEDTEDNDNNSESLEKTPLPFLMPVANAGLDIDVYVDETVHFDASLSTDADGDIIQYQWSNGLEVISFSTLFSKVGTYQIMLTVTDNDQQVASDTRTVVVRARLSNSSTAGESPPSGADLTEPSENNVNSELSGGSVSWLLFVCFIQFLVQLKKLYKSITTRRLNTYVSTVQ
jgi:hypothetical protein